MKRAILAGAAIAAVIAAAGGGFIGVRGHLHSTDASNVTLVSPAVGADRRRSGLLSGPGRPPALLAEPQEDARWPRLPRRAGQRGSQLRRRTGRRSRSRGDGGPQDQVLPQPDGAARHLAGPEEGFDGDGLHPGLRRRRCRRRVGEAVTRKDPADRRQVRARRAARHPHRHSSAGNHSARRTPGFGHLDEIGKLGSESDQRHDGHQSDKRPAADGNLQPVDLCGCRRIHRDHQLQDDGWFGRLWTRLASAADEPRRSRRCDHRPWKGAAWFRS